MNLISYSEFDISLSDIQTLAFRLKFVYQIKIGCSCFIYHLRNGKHFPRFDIVIETRVEVWENEKLKWEHEPVGRVFPSHLELSETSTSVSITHGNREKMFSICF